VTHHRPTPSSWLALAVSGAFALAGAGCGAELGHGSPTGVDAGSPPATGGTGGTPGGGGAPGGSGGAPGTGGTGGATGGAGGSVVPPPRDARPADATPAPPRDAGAPPPVGPPPPADVLTACTPQTVNVTVQNPASAGGQLFNRLIVDPQASFKMIAIKVCSALYASTTGLRVRPTITLNITDPGNGVAATNPGNSTINFSGTYIAGLMGRGDAAAQFEIEGVIAHESVHIYQIFGGPTWLTEGMADAIRFRTGWFRITNRRRGGNWDGSYQTTGFFLAWVDDMYPEFIHKLNLLNPKSEASFMALTGMPVQTLWDAYQAAIP
jgi:Peptidase of plants and bacteria